MNDYKVYICKDGRARIYLKDINKVISYPKFIMEQKLGRELLPNEQVHHKDGNPLNNEIDNLEIKLLGEHQREHNPQKYYDKYTICEWCGKSFLWTANQQRNFYRNQGRKNRITKQHINPFCSKKCVGEFGKHKQNIN